jgi:hypothetical protein
MSERAAGSPMGNSEKQKRKRLSSIVQKVELLQKLDLCGVLLKITVWELPSYIT